MERLRKEFTMSDTLEIDVAGILGQCISDLDDAGLTREKIAAVLRARADLYAPRRPETEAAERAADAARIDAMGALYTKRKMEEEQRVERFKQIERAYLAALDGRDPKSVSALDLLPSIFAAVPDM